MSRYLNMEDEAAVLAAYANGETAREIGDRIGRSKTTVLNVLRRNGLLPRAAAARDNSGARNPNWKGGRYVDGDGYVMAWTPEGHRREHRLVAGACPGTIVHHKDHDRTNNCPTNLAVLPSHAAHRREHAQEERAESGKARFPPPMQGEAHPKAKLTAADVAELRRLRGVVGQRTLAKRFGVSKTAVRYAQRGRNWKHLPTEVCNG